MVTAVEKGAVHEQLLTARDLAFFDSLRSCLVRGHMLDNDRENISAGLAASNLPQSFWGFGIAIYQPGRQRLMVVRAERPLASECIYQVLSHAVAHPRFTDFTISDHSACRIQFDFIEQPNEVEFESLSDSVLGENRFEMGVDGLRILSASQRRYFFPGDAFVHSILGMQQLAAQVRRLFPNEQISELRFQRFRSDSYVSVSDSWEKLLRGLPRVEPATSRTLAKSTQAGIDWILANSQSDGRFVYYYDPATDSHRDHEHPQRDPVTNPYYNLLRHCGGVLTLLHYVAVCRESAVERQIAPEAQKLFSVRHRRTDHSENGADELAAVIRRGIEFFGSTLVRYTTERGEPAAYAYFNNKAKLGGSGIGLYMLAFYQRLFGDDRYAEWARLLANHLENQILPSGEFKYYHVYLDRPVAVSENQSRFSFYYPGEAIVGLANYCQHVCTAGEDVARIHERLHAALRFLLIERPHQYKEHYKSLPADSWLMMAIHDLWDDPGFQLPLYKRFVFGDADQMASHMYTEEDALFPDYVGSFYYQYGDHPFPDGARSEGLLAAYLLAKKANDRPAQERYFSALRRLAWATLRLCNDERTLYSVPNPAKSLGGIRFKLTRQWFRIDTIQHVACFYLKFLPSLHERSI